MNKKELIKRTVDVLKENDVRKHITTQRTTLHITDDEGNRSDFVIKKDSRGLLLTSKDVEAVIDAILAIAEDALKKGDCINIHGFGKLGLKYRAARKTIHPDTREEVDVKARYVPKFDFGNILRMAAKVYELSLPQEEEVDDIGNRS